MTRYAFFDSTLPPPVPVRGWLDTDVVSYSNLPPAANLLELTDEQWANRTTGLFAVTNNILEPYTPPPPVLTLAQQAQVRLAQGLTVVSTAAPTFSALYAIDPVAQGKIGAISTYILVNGTFPGGASTYPWLDFNNTPHAFVSTAMFQQFATAVADYVAALDLIMAINSGTLPLATVNIA